MVNITESFKIFSEKAKETAYDSKERLGKWAEAKKIKKYKQNVERKDLIGNQILFVKKQIAETEEKVNHLKNVSVRSISFNIEGMDFALSTESILVQYEDTLTLLLKRKDKMIREFLSLEESINNDKETGAKVDAIEERKKGRYQTIKTNSKETIFEELFPLIVDMSNFIEEDKRIELDESFGFLELAHQGNRLETRHNGLIVNIQLDQFGDIEHAAIGDWSDDEPVRLAKGQSNDITLLDWEQSSPMNYLDEFFEMGRALKFFYEHYEELV